MRNRRTLFLEWIKAHYDRFFKASDYLHPVGRAHMERVLDVNICSIAWLYKYRGLPLDMVTVKMDNDNVLAKRTLLAMAEFSSPRAFGRYIESQTGRPVSPYEAVSWLEQGPPEWAVPYIEEQAARMTQEVGA